MVGTADAEGSGRRGDEVSRWIVLAYPAGNGTNRTLEQRHENLVGGAALGLNIRPRETRCPVARR